MNPHIVHVLLLIAFGNIGQASIYIIYVQKSSNPEGSCVIYDCVDYFDGRPYQEEITISWKDSQGKTWKKFWYFKSTSHEYVLDQVDEHGTEIGKTMLLDIQQNVIKLTIYNEEKMELAVCGFNNRELTEEAKNDLEEVCGGKDMKLVNQTNCD